MTRFDGAMQRIEEALERGEDRGLDLETLVQIEMTAARLPSGTEAAKPEGKFNLYESADLLHRAINICPARNVEILLCDLGEWGTWLPDLDTLLADPDFAEAWGFMMRLSKVHPVIDYRESSLSSVPKTLPGDAVTRMEYGEMIDPLPCLILKPGRPTAEEYAAYRMSRTTTYREYMDTGEN